MFVRSTFYEALNVLLNYTLFAHRIALLMKLTILHLMSVLSNLLRLGFSVEFLVMSLHFKCHAVQCVLVFTSSSIILLLPFIIPQVFSNDSLFI